MQYNDLLKKKKIVENDKSKIAELIEELDQKKNEALRGAYERVNKVMQDAHISTLLSAAVNTLLCTPSKGGWRRLSLQ